MGALRDIWKNTLGIASYIVPAAGRQQARLQAKDAYNLFANWNERETFVDRPASTAIRALLAKAGANVETDKPYIEILGLKGGKKEFDLQFSAR